MSLSRSAAQIGYDKEMDGGNHGGGPQYKVGKSIWVYKWCSAGYLHIYILPVRLKW